MAGYPANRNRISGTSLNTAVDTVSATKRVSQVMCKHLVLVLRSFHLATQQVLVADTRPVPCDVEGKVMRADADATPLVDEIRQQWFLELLYELHGDQQRSQELHAIVQYTTELEAGTHKSANNPHGQCFFCASLPRRLIFWPQNKWVSRTHHVGTFLRRVWWSQLRRFLRYRVVKQTYRQTDKQTDKFCWKPYPNNYRRYE